MTWLAGILSALWFIIIGLYLVGFRTGSSSVDKLLVLEPNNFGDFLSGAFAPVAFAWLAYSVIMQRQELALQRKELAETRELFKAQEDAQRHSAAQAAELAAVSQKQLTITNKIEADKLIEKHLNSVRSLIWSVNTCYAPSEERGHDTLWSLDRDFIASGVDTLLESMRKSIRNFNERNEATTFTTETGPDIGSYFYDRDFELPNELIDFLDRIIRIYEEVQLTRDRRYNNCIFIKNNIEKIKSKYTTGGRRTVED